MLRLEYNANLKKNHMTVCKVSLVEKKNIDCDFNSQ